MDKSRRLTLINILIVIAILAILSAVIIPNVIGLMHRDTEMDEDLPGQKELRIKNDKTTELLRF